MTQTFFVTGTDTGVGKTAVTCALVRSLTAAGYRARAIKPIETGCAVSADGELLPADALAHRAASGLAELPLERFIRYRLREPLAPAVAAERAGVDLDISTCLELIRTAQTETDILLVEGAGGLLVPFTGTARNGYQTVADVIETLGVPVLVVARARLGTLNHVLLTWEELRRRNLVCAGVILNDVDAEAGLEREDNARVLRTFGVPVLAELPYTAHLESHLADVVRCITGSPRRERS
ncbi:MAG: dethiobiotin synthase [Chloracidobacterium sp.]|uniref:ATP-dependent dethiobiotin synthetase BioD n=1 Tax=Chloracidobacterium validum TaxID=2821543 RepID=A0ABX8BBM7_9BACT|nr:dethiobiotin synthase [Chloracidobacterium validum]QUW03426.1 dethiobiotin synthase [Chloracidobacterium validum]